MAFTFKRRKRIAWITLGILGFIFFALTTITHYLVQPTLRKKIHALIVDGSNGLYTYKLEGLDAGFFTSAVHIDHFELRLDSNRYRQLQAENALPSLTAEIDLDKGQINGVGVLSLIFGKKIIIDEIASQGANIKLMRHPRVETKRKKPEPLWKAMQPALKGISIGLVKFDEIKFLYKTTDTATSMKLQFDRFDARFENLRIDSAAAADTSRIFFSEDITFRFHDLKYRNADSTYKLKAEWIVYSSKNNTVEIDSFKLQPTLDKEDFYRTTGLQKTLYYVEFDKVKMTGMDVARFINSDAIVADSVILNKPRMLVYNDKTQEKVFSSKEGSFPQQKLLNAASLIHFKHIVITNGKVESIEKAKNTRNEGKFLLTSVNMHMQNVTNDSIAILANPFCTIDATANIFGSSPMTAAFKFYLDSTNARYDVSGSVKNVDAAQLNQLSVPLSNIYLPSLQLHELNFSIKADEWTGWADVDMRYNNLAIIMRQQDENNATVVKGFLTKIINSYAVHANNPGPDGVVRKARNVKFMRLTTQAFFGMIWKSLFAGMQQIILKSP